MGFELLAINTPPVPAPLVTRACRRANCSTSRGVHERAQPRVSKVVGMWPLSSARLTDRLVLRRPGSSRRLFRIFFAALKEANVASLLKCS